MSLNKNERPSTFFSNYYLPLQIATSGFIKTKTFNFVTSIKFSINCFFLLDKNSFVLYIKANLRKKSKKCLGKFFAIKKVASFHFRAFTKQLRLEKFQHFANRNLAARTFFQTEVSCQPLSI